MEGSTLAKARRSQCLHTHGFDGRILDDLFVAGVGPTQHHALYPLAIANGSAAATPNSVEGGIEIDKWILAHQGRKAGFKPSDKGPAETLEDQ